MLFASEDELRRQQYQAARHVPEAKLTPIDQWRETVENEREVRMHRRMRQFAWLLFIAPAIASLVAAIVQWAVLAYMARS